jgi:hypothetical protein
VLHPRSWMRPTPGQYLPLRFHSSSNGIVSVLRGGDYLYFDQGVFG